MDDTFDDKYEFNAPKFVDFTQGDNNDDADKWFDDKPGDEGGIDLSLVESYEEAMQESGFSKATAAISQQLFEAELENENEMVDRAANEAEEKRRKAKEEANNHDASMEERHEEPKQEQAAACDNSTSNTDSIEPSTTSNNTVLSYASIVKNIKQERKSIHHEPEPETEPEQEANQQQVDDSMQETEENQQDELNSTYTKDDTKNSDYEHDNDTADESIERVVTTIKQERRSVYPQPVQELTEEEEEEENAHSESADDEPETEEDSQASTSAALANIEIKRERKSVYPQPVQELTEEEEEASQQDQALNDSVCNNEDDDNQDDSHVESPATDVSARIKQERKSVYPQPIKELTEEDEERCVNNVILSNDTSACVESNNTSAYAEADQSMASVEGTESSRLESISTPDFLRTKDIPQADGHNSNQTATPEILGTTDKLIKSMKMLNETKPVAEKTKLPFKTTDTPSPKPSIAVARKESNSASWDHPVRDGKTRSQSTILDNRTRSQSAQRPAPKTGSGGAAKKMKPPSPMKAKRAAIPVAKSSAVQMKAKGKFNPSKISMPKTPSFMRRMRAMGPAKKGETSEMMELRKIKELQKAAKEVKKQSSQSHQQAMKTTSYMPVRAVTQVTVPKEFNFKSDTRLKGTDVASPGMEGKAFDKQLRGGNHTPPPSQAAPHGPTKPKPFQFASRPTRSNASVSGNDGNDSYHEPKDLDKMLRGGKQMSPGKKLPPTKPKPFNLTSDKRDTNQAAKNTDKWESVATQAEKIFNKTPARFRKVPAKEDYYHKPAEKSKEMKITQPKTPKLSSKARNRPITAVSKTELEDKEVEDMKSYKFKATEINPMIVQCDGMYGVKNVQERPVTESKPFNFTSDQRLAKRTLKKEAEQPEPAKKTKRSESSSRLDVTNSENVPQRPKVTQAKPFSFETRDKARYAKKEEKIKQVYKKEKEMANFHATGLPDLEQPSNLPVVEKKQATQAAPFNMTEGSAYTEKWKQQRAEEEEQERKAREFKARPAEVLHTEAFKPKTGLIPPTEITNLHLNTDIRARERGKFEEWKDEQDRIKEEEKMALAKEREEAEIELGRQQREAAHPKAQPIRNFKPVVVAPSSKPLTMPATPGFATNVRLGKRT